MITPSAVASEQATDTPERAELDFTFKNAWMARVAQGFTKEEVVDLALSLEHSAPGGPTSAPRLQECLYQTFSEGMIV
jgi:hypothetical protein